MRLSILRRAISLALALLPVLVSADELRPPLSLHPDNPRYFLWRGRPTVLVASGEHYGSVVNPDFDYKRYLATISAAAPPPVTGGMVPKLAACAIALAGGVRDVRIGTGTVVTA